MFHLSVFVETGTFMGDTVAAAVPIFGEIHTIELSPELAQRAAQRFEGIEKVRVHHGDSADRLLEILGQTSGAPLIWLDGHYSEGVTARGRGNTPVIDELRSIDRSGIANAVILIDDLRLFDVRAPLAGDPASLAGYPSVQELYSLVGSMTQNYQMFVYGDVALILPGSAGVQVSPLVMAMTISRMADGSNLPIEEVLAAEEVIAATRGAERDALRQLTQSRSVRGTEGYGLGLHYRLWEGLAVLGEDAAAAEREFAAVIKQGFPHWRAKWYPAQACAALGKTSEMRDYLAGVLASNPSFAPALLMLGTPKPATSAGGSDLDKLAASGLWREGQALRLHLGCGEQRFEGYINIDYPSDQHNVMQVRPDYQANITQLDFPPQSVDEIRLHHVFEHFNRVSALAMLIKWQQWLKVGGKLHIETPDLMGSAEVLVSKAPWSMKMGAVRHLAGDQAASWAYHVDHWFPERYEHTLKQLGFNRVETQTTRWPHPPHLCNVHAVGIKTEILNLDQLLAAADALLWESTLAPVEKPTYDVWTRQLRAALKNNLHSGPENIHVADVKIAPVIPVAPVAVPAPAPRAAKAAPTAPAAAVLPLAEIHDFNQRSRDRWVQAKAATIPAGSRVLDIGAGTCLYRPLFAHCEYKTHDFMQYEGAEKHGGTSAYGKIDYVSEILAIPVPDHSFDVILCTEVLEHVPEPIKVLKEISRILRPGGRALITAPLGSGLHQLPFHFYGGYTPEWYRRFSKEAGLEATEITPNGGFFKHLAQECVRAANHVANNRELHGPDVNELHKLLVESLPRLFFAMDDKCFDERFTVGYFVEVVKAPINGGVKEALGNRAVPRPAAIAQPVVVKLMGGLGNQMFQYAAGLALARRTGAKLTLDLSFLLDRTPRPDFVFRNYDLDLFDLAAECEVSKDARAAVQGLPLFREKHFNYDPAFESLAGPHQLDGYWQSPRYFEAIADEIRRTFTAFRTRLTSAQEAMAKRIRGSQAVCVNVRRGDFVSTPQGRTCHGVCEADYFRHAAQVIMRRVPAAHFFIFSDDVKWCQQANLLDGAPCTFVGHDYAGDRFGAYLQLMMSCRHFIVPNSTFGWWAAFLGTAPDKIVIAPEPWFSSLTLDSSDLLPKDWIRLCRNPGPAVPDTDSTPTVSVVVPCYKQAHYLAEAIASVVAQTFSDWELIVVNDGSPDETSRVAREIIACHPERRIRLVEKANGGLADARNAGIKEARGKYILPLDADDRIHPEMLAKTVQMLDTQPEIGIAYTDMARFGAVCDVFTWREYDLAQLPFRNQLNCCSLFRREAWTAAGGYNPNMKLGYEDWDFWVGCGEKGFVGKHLPEPLFLYRIKEASMYTKAVEHHRELHAQIVMNHPGLYAESVRREAERILAAVAARNAETAPTAAKPRASETKASTGLDGAVDPIAKFRAQAREFVAQENWLEAAETCANAVYVSRDDLEILHIFAHALANLDAREDALTIARRLVALKPDESDYTDLMSALEGADAGPLQSAVTTARLG